MAASTPPEAIRICQVVASLSRRAGGLFESVRGLATALNDAPTSFSLVVGLRDRFTEEDRPAWGNVPIVPVDVLGPMAFGYAPGLADAIAETDPKVLVNHGIWMYPSIVVRRVASALKIPYIISPHGMLDPWALARSRWKKNLALAAYESGHLRNAASLRALNESEARSIRKLGLTAPICVIPNGVTLPRFAQKPPAPEWKAKVPSGSKVLLFIGRLHPKKGLSELIAAWNAARGSLSDWHLIIAGWDDGGHQANLQSQASSSEACNTVSFVGPLFGEQKHRTFCHSDAFILPSKSEGLPMAVLEAWAYKVPVLMSRECNLPSAFTDGAAIETGTSIPEIAAALETLAGLTAGDQSNLAVRGYELASRRYSWETVARDFAAVAAWVRSGGGRPDCVIQG